MPSASKAFQKMQRIHAWQNWLDEQRCRTYRDSDTREWRDRRDRWDVTKAKPPLFGSIDITFYDVDEARDVAPDPRGPPQAPGAARDEAAAVARDAHRSGRGEVAG